MAKSLTISVIIVSWNVADVLKLCIESVLATKYPHLEIIVVDNASTDSSEKVINEFIKKHKITNKNSSSLEIKLIKNNVNVGFPKAVNQALDKSTGDYLLLLNPDARIPSDFFEKSLQFFADNPDCALMGPKLADPNGTVQGSVFPEPSVVDTFKEFWLNQTGLTQKFIPATYNLQPVSVNAVSGACMFFPRQTVVRIGRFTEKVFMYYEDLDYCRRIRLSGWKIYFHPGITVVHEHGNSAVQSLRANPAKLPFWQGYLWDSSLWYNGWLKHWLISLISYSGQKFARWPGRQID